MNTCTITNICTTSNTKNICEHTSTTYTCMHHQIPPKNKICLVHHNKYMSHIHHEKHMWGFMHHIHIHAPPRTYVSIHVPHTHTWTTYTYMHHQIPPKWNMCDYMYHNKYMCHIHQKKPYVTYIYMHHQEHMSAYMHHIHIHGQHTHTCTTKYHQNGRCVNTCTITNICGTSTKKNICEHTCTTYMYMHHQILPKNKISLFDLTSELYERPDQNVSIHTPPNITKKYLHHQIPPKK